MRLYLLITSLLAMVLISASIDLNDLANYSNTSVPRYIDRDNTPADNAITDEGATLGRVLFYDKRLSANNTIACGSCHIQAFAFSDTAQFSVGLDGGVTGRHAMRLVNSRFGEEERFFWDERAVSLEDQTSQPIQDHVEMGYSGTEGDPDINDLIIKLSNIEAYQRLFELVFGDAEVTEDRIQLALSQFVRSIQSFDSKFDEGLAETNNLNANFPNFTPEENAGKELFLLSPNQGGAGCNGCHRAPEFDIDPESLNNGVIRRGDDSGEVDVANTRSPSLRDLVNPAGQLNGQMMHNGAFTELMQVIDHYNDVTFDPQINTNLDPRLRGGPPEQGQAPQGQQLNLDDSQKEALVAFLETLTGSDMYTNPKYSDPFEPDGTLTLLPTVTSIKEMYATQTFSIYPNPSQDHIQLSGLTGTTYTLNVYDVNGKVWISSLIRANEPIAISELEDGVYLVSIYDHQDRFIGIRKMVKLP